MKIAADAFLEAASWGFTVGEKNTVLDRATLVVAILALFFSGLSVVFTYIERRDRQQDAINTKVNDLSKVNEIADLRELAQDPSTSPKTRNRIILGLAARVQDTSARPSDSYSYFSKVVPNEAFHAAGALRELLREYPTKVGLDRVDLRGISWGGLKMGLRSRVVAADLRAANLSKARFDNVDLRSADLRCANLSDADLVGKSNLSDADLRWADLRGANLQGSRGLTPEQLEGITYDNTTRWPRDLLSLPEALPSATDYESNADCAKDHLRETQAQTRTSASTQNTPSPTPSQTP